MLFTIFNKIWHFEKKMQKTAKTSFFYERDYIYIYYIYFTYILYIYYVLYIYKYMYIYIYIYIWHQQVPLGRQKGHIVPLCYSSDLMESKCYKLHTLIDFLAETDQDQHLKLKPQSHILFWKVFFDKNTVSPLGKYLWQEYFVSPKHSYFCQSHCQILGSNTVHVQAVLVDT